MKTFKVLLLGFGNAAKAYCKLLIEKEDEIAEKFGYKVIVVGIATGSRGKLVNVNGIDLKNILDYVEKNKKFDSESPEYTGMTNEEMINKIEYDAVVELTPLNIKNGEPAISHVKGALVRGKHAITGNKGPVAFAYRELKNLASEKNVKFLYETTVMDGTPIFNLVDETLKLCRIKSVSGIFNTTTNFILVEMEKGKSYEEAIEEGRRRGFVEADPAMDIEGFDSATKTCALLNALMDANIIPSDIERKGIENISIDDIVRAKENGKIIKLVCKGYLDGDKVRGEVMPVAVDRRDVLATIDGTSSVIKIETDLMGAITIIENDPEIEQTGYGIFSDTLRLLE